ncbi:MAG: hypothetical protein NT092_00660 [Bacteroidia bacterium]|nr:hypothetical protein [Bacteroidia bacterium]
MMISGTSKPLTDTFAKIISAIFHPLLMPLYGLLIIFSAPTLFGYMPLAQKKFILLILSTNNILLPLLMLPYLKWRKMISSWTIDVRTERIIPLAITSFFYFVTVYVVLRFNIPVFIKAFFLSTGLLSFAMTIINFWWKISVHSVGAGALTSLIFVLSFRMHTPLTPFLISAILVSGLILSSRLWLNSHNPKEVWLGYLVGVAGMTLLLFVL